MKKETFSRAASPLSAEVIRLAPYRKLAGAIEDAGKIHHLLKVRVGDRFRAREARGEDPKHIEATMEGEEELLSMLAECRSETKRAYEALKKSPADVEVVEKARKAYRDIEDVLQETLQYLRDTPAPVSLPRAANDNDLHPRPPGPVNDNNQTGPKPPAAA